MKSLSHQLSIITLLLALPVLLYAKEPVSMKAKKPVLSFIENKGQIVDEHGMHRNDIQFRLRGASIDAFIGSGKIQYQWNRNASTADKTNKSTAVDLYHMDMVLENANTAAHVITSAPDDYYENYYLGQCPNGATAHTFRKITFQDIYPNIDWVIYIDHSGNNDVQGKLKYDFIVHPGGNVQDIKMQYNGATSVSIKNGKLEAVNPFGTILEQEPYSYEAGTNKVVASAYTINDNKIGFNVGDFNNTLVIDPNLEWGTYFGKTGVEYAYTVATDTAGAAYMGGYTTSTSNIAISAGAFQSTYGGGTTDAFAAKLDKNCNAVWATYYGGNGNEDFWTCSIDTSGNIYFAGNTSTNNTTFATTNQTVFGGGNTDCYIVKFAPNGTRIWSSYYGGPGDEQGSAEYNVWITADKFNDVYLCGNTQSATGMTAGTSIYQSSLAGATDGFLAKFTTNGTRIWGTYFGGAANDRITKVATDPSNGTVYIAGETYSTSGIATSGIQQTTLTGGADAFLAKFTPGGILQWSTYFGAELNETPEGLAVDQVGNIFMAGTTISVSPAFASKIASPGCYQSLPGGNADVFLARFNSSGFRVWGTFWGTAGIDHCGDVAIDASGNVCFTGFTTSTSGIATVGAYQTVPGGSFDAYLAVFTITGIRYYASYLGGGPSSNDYGYGLKYSKAGDLYLSGTTFSINNISYGNNPYQATLSGSADAMLFKFKADTSTFILQPFPYTVMCGGDSMYVDFGVTAPFKSNNTFNVELSDENGFFSTTSPVVIGTLNSITAGTIKCRLPDTTHAGTLYRVQIVSVNPSSKSIDNQSNITIKLLPVKPVIVSNTPVCSGTTLNLSASTSTAGVSYAWTGPLSFTSTQQNPVVTGAGATNSGNYIVTASLNGCASKDTEAVLVNITPVVPTVGANTPICSGSTLNLTSNTTTPGVSYSWTGPSFSSNQKNPSINAIPVTGSGYYKSTASLTGCSSSDSVLVTVNPTYTPFVQVTADPGNVICINDSITFTAVGAGGGTNPTYQWIKNNVVISGATSPVYGTRTIANNDVMKCAFAGAGTTCFTKTNDTSTGMVITVTPPQAPGVLITTIPTDITQLVAPSTVTFTATTSNAGTAPTYQWVLNGNDIPGAIAQSYIATAGVDIKTGDQICVRIKSSSSCSVPDTANFCLQPAHVDVEVVNNILGRLILFPNPNNGFFTLRGSVHANDQLSIEILNPIGQVVYTDNAIVRNNFVDKNIMLGERLPDGVYLLRIKTGDAARMVRFTLNK